MFCTRYFLTKFCTCYCNIDQQFQTLIPCQISKEFGVLLKKLYIYIHIDCDFGIVFPAIFRSLLYEACGRIVNPIYGSVGLLWSGSWHLCQAAVEAVLKGEPITPIDSEADENERSPPFKAYDIRHVSKDENSEETKQVRTRSRFRRAMKPKPSKEVGSGSGSSSAKEVDRSKSQESSLSQPGKDSESGVSVETSILFHDESEFEPESQAKVKGRAEDRAEEGLSDGVGLELRLGIEPVSHEEFMVPIKKRKIVLKDCSASSKVELGLDLSA